MWLFTYNHTCFGYIQITTLNNKNTLGAPYFPEKQSLQLAFKSLYWCRSAIVNRKLIPQGDLLWQRLYRRGV